MLYVWLILFVLTVETIERLSGSIEIPNDIITPRKSTTRELCSGSENSRAELQDENRIEQLRKQYENCTRVYGNLEITHIRKEHLNGTDSEKVFSFLDHIQQITGYLLIYSNEFERISLRNLEIVWGDVKHEGIAAVHIINNPKLKYINMPRLRSVERGAIVLSSNDYLCNWNETILYSEITDKTRVKLGGNNFRKCGGKKQKCAESCHGYCWGPGEDKCQTVYRSICRKRCASGMCFRRGNETGCCDESCAAGCYGEGKNECIACAQLEQDSQCVDQCNGLTSYDRTKMMTVNHPNPRYTYDRYCVERCPDETLIQDAHCVVHCREGYWHDPEKNTRVCEKCPNGVCPKTCILNEPVDAENIKSLQNCTLIEGYIKFLRHTFEPHKKFDSNVYPMRSTSVPALTSEMLEALSSVKVVTEYVDVQAGEYTPTSLSFLRNLATIEGRKLSDNYALSVSNNQNLRELGLRSLKKISNGRVYIGANVKLCYVDTMSNYWSRIVDMAVEEGGYKARVVKNRNPELCKNLTQTCDAACNQTAGCWGQGPTMCLECERFDMGDRCVTHCPEIGYYVEDARKCKKCDPECVRCTGGTALNCTECVHVALQQGGGIECLEKCPLTHYTEGNICLPCSPACYDFGCTGGGSHLGAGGCNKCMHAKRACKTCNRFDCLIAPAKAKDVCKDNNLTNYYTTSGNSQVEQFECEKCADECLSCIGYGNSVHYHKCNCAHYLTVAPNNGDYCTMMCDPRNTYVVREESAIRPGECRRCNELCDMTMGCNGDLPTNCTRCASAAVFTTEDVMVCVDACPPDQPFQTEDKVCHSLDPVAVTRKNKRTTMVLSAVGASFVLLVLMVLVWKCKKYKRRYKKEVELNLPALPECEPMDPNAKPNMSRLCLISSEHLSKTSRPLGKGAFGIVYAGYWWPNGKDGHEKVVVAIKVVQDASGTAQQEMLAEAGIMASMRHEHLLRLVGVCLSGGIQLVTPLRPLGNLRDFLIKHRQKLGARDLLLYCYQIASAMEYLYKNRLVHRDLAARNVLVKRTNHVEVTDFGLAKMLERGKSEIIVGGKVAVKWLALESLLYRSYTHWTDVWAFGVTCWEVLTFGQTPYQAISPENIRAHLESGNRLEQPNNCTQDVYQTLVQCWLSNPESRPSFVLLREKFKQFCSCPDIYVLDRHHPHRMESLSCGDQRELINELLEDNDFTDPLEYFDEHDEHTTTTTVIPLTPTSPAWSTKPDIPTLTRHDQRLVSTDSGRYQSEPVPGYRTEIGMDEGNYLVPNTKQSPALLYTPVVVHENGETELMKSSEYYNDKVGGQYYNEFGSIIKDDKRSDGAVIRENQMHFETTL
uniref:receptor protein-tyrosine kinase n=2 Tax=Parascaris univalens TaxID=6257 RepID=A0A915AJB3_PARUN